MDFKEEWLFPGAVVPVDAETTQALVEQIHRLIRLVGSIKLEQAEQKPVAQPAIAPVPKFWYFPMPNNLIAGPIDNESFQKLDDYLKSGWQALYTTSSAAPQPAIAPSLPDAQPANWRLK